MSSEVEQQAVEGARVVTPSAEDISIALQQLLLQEPAMGLKKLHAGVKALHSDWIVSEARVKKIKDSLAAAPQAAAAAAAQLLSPPTFDEHGRIAGTSAIGLNFSFRSVPAFVPELDPAVMTQLHTDCRRAFLMKSYWLSASAAPRCMLEALAAAVFDFHTRGVAFDAATSGVEWWVHFRGPGEDKKLGGTAPPLLTPPPPPSPFECHRFRFAPSRTRSHFYFAGESIGFHWDKDETLADVHGIKAYPQVSTVTYLSSAGAPTVVLQHARNNIPGSHSVPSGFVSHPAVGKHISFDGRLLHGVPAEISDSSTPAAYTRVTFLANVWVNHALVGIEALPEHLAQQM
jgi:hypothetical protein